MDSSSNQSAGLQYTCITCAVGFQEADLQREHYKTDWHRYNLKRKVAVLSPVTKAEFDSRLAKHAADKVKADATNSSGYCVACSKNFSTEKAFHNHVKSKKHLEASLRFEKKDNKVEIIENRKNKKIALEEEKREAELGDGMEEDGEDIEEVDSDEWNEDEEDPIPRTDCLFCLHHSSTIEKNAIHMSTEHSFFIPDLEYLVDLPGLFEYLGAKVGQGRMCLWCNEKGRSFRSCSAVQKHMTDKGHCKLLHEGDAIAEFADFYDYSSSYPDNENGANEDITAKPDSEVDLTRLDDTGFELVLPSGAKVGHRSLMRYFRQNLTNDRALVPHKMKGKDQIRNHYQTFGWVGLSKPEAKMKARDMNVMRRVQQKHWMRLGMKGNQQKHFRDPTGFLQ